MRENVADERRRRRKGKGKRLKGKMGEERESQSLMRR